MRILPAEQNRRLKSSRKRQIRRRKVRRTEILHKRQAAETDAAAQTPEELEQQAQAQRDAAIAALSPVHRAFI